MIDVRQPFDLRQNEDFLFAKTPWWMSNFVLTTGKVSLALLGSVAILAVYAKLIGSVVGMTQTWVAQ